MTTYTRYPTEVFLREDQFETLEALAQETGSSLAELIRRGVDKLIGESQSSAALTANTSRPTPPPDYDPIGDLIGMAESGVSDLGTNHDKYIVEALEAESRSWQPKSS